MHTLLHLNLHQNTYFWS